MPTQLYKFYCGMKFLGENRNLLIGKELYKTATLYHYYENGRYKSTRSLGKTVNIGLAFDILKQSYLSLN